MVYWGDTYMIFGRLEKLQGSLPLLPLLIYIFIFKMAVLIVVVLPFILKNIHFRGVCQVAAFLKHVI